MDEKALKAEVLGTLEALNRAWTVERTPERLREFFHPQMVAVTPLDRERLEGGGVCAEAWRAFADSVRVTAWRTHGEKVQLWAEGQVAVVTCYFEMRWETPDGKVVDADGRDMYVLTREDGRWRVVADQFSSYPARS